MSTENKKFYPFSDAVVPDKYDAFLLLNKEQSEYLKANAETGKKSSMTFHENEMTPEKNTSGKFNCLVGNGTSTTAMAYYFQICHVFTIIDKDEEVVGNWEDKCPTSLNELRPLSLKDRSLVETNYKASFPKIFLVAIKWKNINTPYEWFGPNGKKKVENISQLMLSFPKENDSNYQIFSWGNTAGGKSVFCDKDLLNLKN